MDRPEYLLNLIINDRKISRVLIDQHYRENHRDLSDEIILELLEKLNNQSFPVEMIRGEFEYFRAEPVILNQKAFRMILLLPVGDDFLGVVNAFRVDWKK